MWNKSSFTLQTLRRYWWVRAIVLNEMQNKYWDIPLHFDNIHGVLTGTFNPVHCLGMNCSVSNGLYGKNYNKNRCGSYCHAPFSYSLLPLCAGRGLTTGVSLLCWRLPQLPRCHWLESSTNFLLPSVSATQLVRSPALQTFLTLNPKFSVLSALSTDLTRFSSVQDTSTHHPSSSSQRSSPAQPACLSHSFSPSSATSTAPLSAPHLPVQ